MKHPSQRLLRRLLRYEPENGRLIWKARPRWMFNSDKAHAAWNGRFSGICAFETDSGRGYRTGKLLNRRFYKHRIIWIWHNGIIPEGCVIDHIEPLNPVFDDRIENLQAVTQSVNVRKSRPHSRNTSGQTGVTFYRRGNKWRADIYVSGKSRFLGFFDKLEDAIAARLRGETEYWGT